MKLGKDVKIWHLEKSVILDCKIGDDCVIHAFVWIGSNVNVGCRTKIQAFCFIPDGVTLGNDVFLGPRVTFTNDKYPPSHGQNWSTTSVEDGVTIGAGAVILPGITIGKDARIGAGAVVTKNVPRGATFVGNPAKQVKQG